jgi:hypothetical protein
VVEKNEGPLAFPSIPSKSLKFRLVVFSTSSISA